MHLLGKKKLPESITNCRKSARITLFPLIKYHSPLMINGQQPLIHTFAHSSTKAVMAGFFMLKKKDG